MISFRVFALIISFLCFVVSQIDGKSTKVCKTDAAKVKIISCNQLQGKLAKAGKLLQSKGFTKCVQPFGVLVVGKSTFKDSGILATAKIVAELIDQNRDGVADVPSMVKKLKAKAWIIASTKEETSLCSAVSELGLTGTCFEVDKFWHVNGKDMSTAWGGKNYRNGVRTEEVIHMFTQWAWGLEWPNQFGTAKNNNWNESTLTKECRKAKCVWWQHPENNCPDKMSTVKKNQKSCKSKDLCTGTCAGTNCDCVEWYQQVVTTSIGMTPAWRSPIRDSLGKNKTVPKTKKGMLERLTPEMKDLLQNPIYHQPMKALKKDYPEVGKC